MIKIMMFDKMFKWQLKPRKMLMFPTLDLKLVHLNENDHLYIGSNVENAAYPQSQCAEASAIDL